ncbi:hypothetical protein PVAND_015625 [Polypedilum vanderplanki]|uniref:Carboxylic ester hydrolase n=1 Tax=Polypedilum vanderplanki TaxID=319348 RepID=A0A9J6BDP8_POLVA|nr:hypothetical protein PVAND_015625 [Polypedilum vanderplanki]
MSLEKFVTVNTQHGPVKGDRRTTILGMDYINFQGIPYMKAPVGKLRFRAPVEPEKWTETFDATQDCPPFPIYDMMVQKIVGIEDGGRINVFTKELRSTNFYPVLVYIHGGGFQTGTSSPSLFNCPDYLLQKELVIVSFNYRVGALGFLSLDDPSVDVPGNAGLKDQRMALKWIKENIKNFGGDPDNITLFGTSAGGASVHYHLISEKSKGLFHRAIAMSGTSLNMNWAHHPRRNYAERIARLCGYEGDGSDKSILEFLENADFEKIVEASENILTDEEKFQEHVVFANGPVVEPYITDHTFIHKSPILMAREAWSKDIDVIFGGTSNEGLLMKSLPNEDSKRVQYLQDFKNFSPFVDLNLDKNDPKAKEIGNTLKELFYGATTPTDSYMLPYYYYQGDLQFWHGIQRAVLSRIKAGGKGKTFTYYFNIVTEMNIFKKFFKNENFPGAEHGACATYLFKNNFTTFSSFESIEFKNIMKVVGIISNFAIYGHTGVDEWEENKSLELPLRCLHLTKDGMQMIDLPETARLKVWDKIYREAGAVLY